MLTKQLSKLVRSQTGFQRYLQMTKQMQSAQNQVGSMGGQKISTVFENSSISRQNQLLMNHSVFNFSTSQDKKDSTKANQSDSVRNKEVLFYTNLEDWWGPKTQQGQLHKFNKVRVEYIRKMVLSAQKYHGTTDVEGLDSLKVLDIGCGAGILSEGVAKLGVKSVTGIDPTPKCIEMASAHLETQDDIKDRVTYKNVTIEDLIKEHEESGSGPETMYDIVCCSEVIEHVNNQKQFLLDCAKLVNPNGGFLFVSSMAKTPESYFLNIIMGEYVLGLLPKGTHEYELFIDQSTCEQYLNEVGLKTIGKTGVTITNPLTMEMGEIPYLRSNWLMMAQNQKQ